MSSSVIGSALDASSGGLYRVLNSTSHATGAMINVNHTTSQAIGWARFIPEAYPVWD